MMERVADLGCPFLACGRRLVSQEKKSDSAIRVFFLCLRGIGVCGRG
jgi:hypothetical protein